MQRDVLLIAEMIDAATQARSLAVEVACHWSCPASGPFEGTPVLPR